MTNLKFYGTLWEVISSLASSSSISTALKIVILTMLFNSVANELGRLFCSDTNVSLTLIDGKHLSTVSIRYFTTGSSDHDIVDGLKEIFWHIRKQCILLNHKIPQQPLDFEGVTVSCPLYILTSKTSTLQSLREFPWSCVSVTY